METVRRNLRKEGDKEALQQSPLAVMKILTEIPEIGSMGENLSSGEK